MVAGAPECADGAYVVVHQGIRVKSQPVSQVGQSVGEIEGPQARAWIIAREFFSTGDILKAEEAVQERMQGDGRVPFASPYGEAIESELEIAGRFEADLLHVDPRIVWIRVSLQAAHEEVVAEWAGNAGKTGNIQRLNAIDLEIVNILGVIAPQHGCALVGTQPVVALAERNFMVEDVVAEIGFEDAGVFRRRDRAFGDGVLNRIGGDWDAINGI